MPFIPHTEAETRAMLDSIGANDIADLFDEIPEDLTSDKAANLDGMNELAISRLMQERANLDGVPVCFAGAGAYDHHIPAAVWELTIRGEFYSAYTPYQAEASQGTLQLLYEYQSMMASLMALDVSNASLYDGASGLAEAVLMAVRSNRKVKAKRILIPKAVHPDYRRTVRNIVSSQDIELVEIEYSKTSGQIDFEDLTAKDEAAALVIPLPNYFGSPEDVDVMTDFAHERDMLVIALANPMAMSMLKPPGKWGKEGADIACGEGQPLGVPLSSGGPYFGFLCCKQNLARQMPGRIIGRTTDLDGKSGFTLTLQAREQHIRRSKATSNICTNQGLMVTAATIYMSIMGASGLGASYCASIANTRALINKLTTITGVELAFSADNLHEALIKLPANADEVLSKLAARNIVGGVDVSADYPELGQSILVCATEKRTEAEMDEFTAGLGSILAK